MFNIFKKSNKYPMTKVQDILHDCDELLRLGRENDIFADRFIKTAYDIRFRMEALRYENAILFQQHLERPFEKLNMEIIRQTARQIFQK